jgi:hypothetical protein
MSEYQYYEFQAIDRPLSDADRKALRALSTRAKITAASFTNSYEWGDFKGDPAKLMERWFDLHLYLANWGSRRLMMRLPKQMVDLGRLDRFIGEVDWVKVRVAAENLILDILPEEEDADDEWDDGSGRLAELAPLRADVLAGDLRVFYLLWLTAVEADVFEADEPEPMPGIGPVSAALEAFAQFFSIYADLVEAAAERSSSADAISTDVAQKAIAAIPDHEKTALLMRVFEGDPHVGAALRGEVRKRLEPETSASPIALRTAGQLRARAAAIRLARERAEAEKAATERQRQAKEAEKLRRIRLDAVVRRGESVWQEIETEIERRNAGGYDNAVGLLIDLKAIAEERGTTENFLRRSHAIRERHVQKRRFVERLAAIG